VGEPGRDLARFALKLLLFKSVDEFDRGEEPNALAVMLDGLDADRRSEMRLGGAGSRQPRAARWLRGVTLAGGGHRAGHGGAIVVGGILAEVVVFVVAGPTLLRRLGPALDSII